eukprot:Gb_19522 [translate_table: standard]
MEIQALGPQTLITRFIPPSPPTNRFNLQPTVAQAKFCISSKVLVSDRVETVQWSFGCCKNAFWGKDMTSETWVFSSTLRRRDFKGTRRAGPFFAIRNGDQSVPEDNPEEKSESGSSGSTDAGQNFHLTDVDWRAFRARLVAAEQMQKSDHVDPGIGPEPSVLLGPKWAHPIHAPESGCILVATEKLDGTRSFERTVVLLLRAGSNDPREGPFGVILNRPLQRCIKDMKPTNPDLATTFADCPLHFGGPLEASMFLLTSAKNVVPDFEEVIPGLCYGARNSLHRAADLVRNGVLHPQNFRFFLGYSGWELDQLKEEIALDYWYVAACSPNLITAASASSSGLWEEILQLMGGQYAELSRKPKQDSL